ncbi:SafA/ExsA family spore coat assembly protein [Metabacillus litoralis]|uniref:SafA/ExsA family spore coat assembly protein n=1 Tax=Metabacillus litoralis TaxID=152268 RepID=UPI00299DE2CD|nr:SafA/ExsA family spore coat assembly protein [Metabacillus litoralis]
MKIHIVQKGDTLWKIAKKYGVSFEEVKSMNTQLSNPDLIMPGMKIKVPSGNVAVKKEAPIQKEAPIKKEMPLAEHPFAKEKPKAVVDVEDTVPKEPITEKPSKPYIPPVPNAKHPVYTGLEANNYYTVNMAMMPQMPNPQLPPKPANVLPDITKFDEEKHEEKNNAEPYYLPQEEQHKEDLKDMANMPNVPNMPNMQMPAYNQPAMYQPQPQYVAPQYMVPVSPVLPGSGLCPPYYPMQQMPYGPGPAMMPNQPYPTAVSPEDYDDDDDYDYENAPNQHHMPYQQQVAPAQYGPGYGFPVNPYAGVPVSPVMPGTGLGYPNQVMGAYGEAPDGDYGDHANMPPYPQAVSPAYDQDDCGCGGPSPQYANPSQQGYPMAQQYGGYPMQQMQQPYMAQQGYAPYGYNPYGYNQTPYPPLQGQPDPGAQMFGMPNYDREEEED